MRGILNLDKPTGMSSYDAIRRLKRILGPSPPVMGHAGTLDPLASGVLPVLVGPATKVSGYLLGADKEYEAEVLFGRRTDTDDVTGTVVAEAAVPELDPSSIDRLLAGFTGEIRQVPPAFSALKKDGVPLYRRARRGEDVEPAPRTVTVRRLEALGWDPPRLTIRTTVSSGTYIRSLARDLGRSAGSEATLARLVRTRTGPFRLADSVELDALTPEAVAGALVPIPDALPGMPRLSVPAEAARRLAQGRPVTHPDGPEADVALALTDDRRFLAVVRSDGDAIRPVRIVYAESE